MEGTSILMGNLKTGGQIEQITNSKKDQGTWILILNSRCFIQQYSSYEVQPNLFLDGEFTLAENIADNGGLREAFSAYRSVIGQNSSSPSVVKNLSNDQLFFVTFAQTWYFF